MDMKAIRLLLATVVITMTRAPRRGPKHEPNPENLQHGPSPQGGWAGLLSILPASGSFRRKRLA